MVLSRDKWIEINYYKYWDVLFHYSCNITRDKELSADVVQEVFVYIWNNYDNLKIENPKAYLLQSVRNGSLKSLQSVSFNTVHLEEFCNALTDNEVLTKEEEALFKEQLLKMIYEKAMEVLPDKCYQIFILRFSDRLSYKEISIRMGVSEKTVDNQVSKALRVIKSNLPYSVNYVIVTGYLFSL